MTATMLPLTTGRITLKQGGGGRAMRALIEKLFVRDFATLPFEGVGVGASAGVVRLSADEGGVFSSASAASGVVVGTDATYTRLSGKRHNIALSVGGGFKRVLRFGGYDVSAAQLTYPTVRASIGFAF